MFHNLASLHQLLLQWSASGTGRNRLASVSRDPALKNSINRLKTAITAMTGQTPSSDAVAAALYAALTR